MMPGWSVQDLRDRERALRAGAERRRMERHDYGPEPGRVLGLRDFVRTAVLDDPCPEPCLERAG